MRSTTNTTNAGVPEPMVTRYKDCNFFLIVCLGLFLCTSARSSVQQVPLVMTKKAQLTDLFDSLNYPARVESKVNANIYAESDGIVTKILAPLGSRVIRHAKILIIKHTDPIYQYAPFTLFSPVKGIVSQISVTEGSSVTKGQLLAAVTDPSQIRVMVEVAALDLPQVKKDLKGEFKTTGHSASELVSVQVKGISPLVDPATGTATCELELLGPKANFSLPPGSMGQVAFKVNQRKSFVFPDHAVVYKGADTYLRIVNGGLAQRIPVKLGNKQRGLVEILSGLKEGQEVIERASGYVADGEKVQVEK